MILDYDEMPEEERVRTYNDSCPPNAAWELARDFVSAAGIEAAVRRGDFWLDLHKMTEDRRWSTHYGVLAKLYHDAASDERERIRIQADIQHTEDAA